MGFPAIALGRNVGPSSLLANERPDPVRIIATVGKYHRPWLQFGQEYAAEPVIMSLAGRQAKAQRQAIGVHHCVHLAGQSATRPLPRLVLLNHVGADDFNCKALCVDKPGERESKRYRMLLHLPLHQRGEVQSLARRLVGRPHHPNRSCLEGGSWPPFICLHRPGDMPLHRRKACTNELRDA